jgi:hypothetical protein
MAQRRRPKKAEVVKKKLRSAPQAPDTDAPSAALPKMKMRRQRGTPGERGLVRSPWYLPAELVIRLDAITQISNQPRSELVEELLKAAVDQWTATVEEKQRIAYHVLCEAAGLPPS